MLGRSQVGLKSYSQIVSANLSQFREDEKKWENFAAGLRSTTKVTKLREGKTGQ
jgi:hypothetical protein